MSVLGYEPFKLTTWIRTADPFSGCTSNYNHSAQGGQGVHQTYQADGVQVKIHAMVCMAGMESIVATLEFCRNITANLYGNFVW